MSRRWLALVLAWVFASAALPASAQTPIAVVASNWYAAHADASDVRAAETAGDTSPARKGDSHLPLVLGAFLTAASADLAVSMYQIGRGSAREAAFGSGWEHSPVPFALTKSGAAAVFALGLQRMHKDRPKTAIVFGLSATIVESMLLVRAAHMSPAP